MIHKVEFWSSEALAPSEIGVEEELIKQWDYFFVAAQW